MKIETTYKKKSPWYRAVIEIDTINEAYALYEAKRVAAYEVGVKASEISAKILEEKDD